MRKRKFLVQVICWSLLQSSLSLGQSTEFKYEGLDVNDVSFLLPLKFGKPLPAINLVASSLISSEVFREVLSFEKKYPLNDLPYSDASNISKPDNWFVTSLRIDSCGDTFVLNEIKDRVNQETISLARKGSGCVPRLRLVVQPFNDFGFPYPTALHLLYRLDSSALASFIQYLNLAKRAARTELNLETTGIPLSVHPALLQEAQSLDQREVAKTLEAAVVSTLARAEVKIDIVTLIVRATVNHWKFVGGTVRDGHWQRFVTEFSQQFNDGRDPEILSGVEDLSCTIFSVCLLRPLKLPAQLNPNGVIVSEIFQNSDHLKVSQTPGHRSEELLIKAERIDQVSQVHFFNTNCVSCHQSSNLRDREALHLDESETNLYLKGITPFVPKKYLNAFTSNVINFGYFGTIPRISTRTAAESANVAQTINQITGVKNPTKVIKDIDQFWKCIVSHDDFNSCFLNQPSIKEKL